MKFKEGDKVKVKDNSRIDEGKYAGWEGIIDSVYHSVPYPYGVKFETQLIVFHGNELEKLIH